MTPQDFALVRRYLRLTQQELAQELGVSRTTVSRYELVSGRYPIPDGTARLLKFLVTAKRREPGDGG